MKKDKAKLIDWRVDANGSNVVFFETPDGGELFTMNAERFGLLLSPDYVKGQVQEAAQEQLYPSDWGLEKFVGVQRLLQKGLNQSMIAGLLGVPEPMVRAFYGQALQKFQHATDLVRQEWARQGSSETEKDYCLSLHVAANVRMSEDPRAGENFLEIPRMAAILKEEGPGGAAVKMELNFADLQDWIEKNKRYLVLFGWTENLF